MTWPAEGPTNKKRSTMPLSATHCVCVPALLLSTSTSISAAFSLQGQPTSGSTGHAS